MVSLEIFFGRENKLRRLTGLMEKQNSMLEQANRLSQERLDIERQRLELETKALECADFSNLVLFFLDKNRHPRT